MKFNKTTLLITVGVLFSVDSNAAFFRTPMQSQAPQPNYQVQAQQKNAAAQKPQVAAQYPTSARPASARPASAKTANLINRPNQARIIRSASISSGSQPGSPIRSPSISSLSTTRNSTHGGHGTSKNEPQKHELLNDSNISARPVKQSKMYKTHDSVTVRKEAFGNGLKKEMLGPAGNEKWNQVKQIAKSKSLMTGVQTGKAKAKSDESFENARHNYHRKEHHLGKAEKYHQQAQGREIGSAQRDLLTKKAVRQVMRAEVSHNNLVKHTTNAAQNLANVQHQYKDRPQALEKKMGELKTLRGSAQNDSKVNELKAKIVYSDEGIKHSGNFKQERLTVNKFHTAGRVTGAVGSTAIKTAAAVGLTVGTGGVGTGIGLAAALSGAAIKSSGDGYAIMRTGNIQRKLADNISLTPDKTSKILDQARIKETKIRAGAEVVGSGVAVVGGAVDLGFKGVDMISKGSTAIEYADKAAQYGQKAGLNGAKNSAEYAAQSLDYSSKASSYNAQLLGKVPGAATKSLVVGKEMLDSAEGAKHVKHASHELQHSKPGKHSTAHE